jgi:glycolate oxidase iron-sulfur subunit
MLSFKTPKLRYWLLQKLSLANTFGGLNKLASLPILPKTVRSLIANIPRPTQSWPAFKSFYPATKSAISIFGQQGKINLFPGCLGISIDPQTVRSSIFVLNNLGYDVLLENKHQCCGALHHHAGLKLNKNQQYNAKDSNTYPILTLHSGCQSFIEHNSNSNAVNKHVDVLSFLKNHAKQLDYIFNQRLKKQNLDTQSYQDELKSTILSQPCTESSTIDQTLSLIFNTKINSVKDGCCGNAGTYFLRQPDIAQQLTKQRITKLLAFNPKRIWTSNLGCAIAIKGHIATSKSLKSKVNNVIVEHPITTIHQFML